jgi:hypothetical protein
MTFSTKSRYLLITAAVLTASAIQLINGYKLVIVIVAASTFLCVGYLIVYLSGAKQRELDRQRKRDYWAGNS